MIRYRDILIMLLCGFAQVLIAQLPNFYKAYNDLSGNQSAYSVVADDLGYTAVSITLYNGTKYEHITHVDLEGNLVWRKYYGRQYYKQSINGANSIIRVEDGYVLFGHYWPLLKTDSARATEHEYYLFKIDLNGDSLWFKEFNPDPDRTKLAYSMLQDSRDGGFYLLGERLLGDSWVFHLMKTDTLGNLLWEVDIPTSKPIARMPSIDINDSGELLICVGTSYDWSDIYGEYFIISPDGELLIHKELGLMIGSAVNDYPILSPKAHWVPDGSIITASNADTIKITPDSLPLKAPIVIIKMDREGNKIDSVIRWGTTVPLVGGNPENLFALWQEDLDNGDLVLTGQGNIAHMAGSFGSGDFAWAMRISPDLEIKWDRHFYIKDRRDCTGDYNYAVYHAQSTSDNGIVIAGSIIDSTWIDGRLYCNTNVAILKVDSMGCIRPGCSEPVIVVSVEEAESGELVLKQVYFDVYPNPVISSSQLRVDFGLGVQYTQAYLRVSDLMGKAVYQAQLRYGEQEREIDTDGWNSGIYLLSYYDDRGALLQTEKIVVE